MAGAKELKKRIGSVQNTRKITRTMEMVSTSKSRRMMDLVKGAKPYGEKLMEIMQQLGDQKENIQSPYMRETAKPARVAMLILTSNRGLCGGYNSNLLRMAKQRIAHWKSQGVDPEIHVIGKKGISYFKFQKTKVDDARLSKEDSITFQDTLEYSEMFMKRFAAMELDRVEVLSTVYHSSANQKPEVSPLLPPLLEKKGKASSSANLEKKEAGIGNTIFAPSPEKIFTTLIPHVIHSNLYRLFLEAATSEWIYRRVAMKSATDAANEMSKYYNRKYNRIRQATITQELAEIVAGADAVG